MTATQGKRTRLENADLITLAREGRTTQQIADAYGINNAHVVTRLRDLGLGNDGQPLPPPCPPPRDLVVGWYGDGDESWRDQAACFTDGHDPELWFAEGWGKAERTAEAKRVCAGCPVRVKCLEAAMRAEGDVGRQYRAGVFGGLTVDERIALGSAAVA